MSSINDYLKIILNGVYGKDIRKAIHDGIRKCYDDNSASPERVENLVNTWLEDHPEATTTVQDGAISPIKLNTELYKSYLRTESAIHFFPSLEEGGYSANCSLMIVKNKCVLFDCGASVNWTAIKTYFDALYTDGVFVNIDYIVISHYHWDHVQKLADILDSYPHDNCKVYLPLNPSGYKDGTSAVLSIRDQVLNILTEQNVDFTEVSEDTDVHVLEDFCTITLFNSTPDDYAYYSDETDSVYNDYSMCSLVKTGEVYELYPADIQRQAQIRICNTRILPKVVLYSTHHHGIQNDDYIPYIDMIEPEFAVIQTNHERQLISASSSFATNYACEHVYSLAYDKCVVVTGKDGGTVINGRELSKTGWFYNYVDYYIDNEYQGVKHTGTETEPFVSINEALMFVRENSNMSYRLHVKATATVYDYTWIRDFSIPVSITGYANGVYTKPVINGLYIRNSRDVSISNCDFTGTGRTVNDISCLVYIGSSDVYILNCEFNNSGETFYSAILISLSEVYVTGCVFKNLTNVFPTYRYGKLISNGNQFTSCDRPYTVQNMDLVIRGDDVLVDCTYYIFGGNAGSKNITIKSIFSDTELSALQGLMNLNDDTVVSSPFYSKGVTSIIKGKEIQTLISPNDRGVTITNGKNLNDYKTFGKYQSPSSSVTASLTNIPTGMTAGFTLYVETSSATYTKQILIDNDMQIFIRRLSSGGTWGAWFKVSTTTA